MVCRGVTNTQCGEYAGWRIRRVANTQGGEYTGWRMHRVANTQGGEYAGWRIRRVANTQGGEYAGWRIHRVANTQGGEYARWRIHRVANTIRITNIRQRTQLFIHEIQSIIGTHLPTRQKFTNNNDSMVNEMLIFGNLHFCLFNCMYNVYLVISICNLLYAK